MTENNKGSPKYAIPLHVAQVAMKYGKTVSKGIQEMERRIQAQQENNSSRAGRSREAAADDP